MSMFFRLRAFVGSYVGASSRVMGALFPEVYRS
jgi:hypothetical protein